MAPAAMPDLDSDGDGVVDRLDACPDTPHGKKVDARGCPEILLTLTGVNFDFDKSTIKPDAAQILNQAVDELNKAKAVDVRIEGHTDSIGSEAYNLKLSQRRADAVELYLVDHGIPAARLSTEGKGESQPVASNDTAEGRYQNRRVEFHVAGESPVYSSGSTTGVESWRSLDQPVTYY
jgi:outer membrane protein OmpA-like peptidoglycan-associated protein